LKNIKKAGPEHFDEDYQMISLGHFFSNKLFRNHVKNERGGIIPDGIRLADRMEHHGDQYLDVNGEIFRKKVDGTCGSKVDKTEYSFVFFYKDGSEDDFHFCNKSILK